MAILPNQAQAPQPAPQPQAAPPQQGPSEAPQGPVSSPMGGDASAQANAALGGSNGQQTASGGGDVSSKIDQSLNSLPDTDKQFLSVMLTPETVHVINILFGSQIAKELSRFADPETILVPMNRQEFMAHMQGGGQDQGIQSPDEGATDSVDASQGDGMEGPSMGGGNAASSSKPKSKLSTPKMKKPKA